MCCFFVFFCLVSKHSLVNGRDGFGKEMVVVERGGGGVLDGGAESEASLESAGAEASRAAGGFGSPSSRVGTLSDICLLTAAGAAGWMDGGLESWSIQPQPALTPASYPGQTTTTQHYTVAIKSHESYQHYVIYRRDFNSRVKQEF